MILVKIDDKAVRVEAKKLVEVALVKVASVPIRLVNVPVIEVNKLANKFVDVLLVIDAFVENRLVLVAFVIVPFATLTAVKVILALKFVIVALVIIALVPNKFVRVVLDTVKLFAVDVDMVVVPTILITPFAEIRILSTGVTDPVGVVQRVSRPGILPAAGVPSTDPRILAPSWKAAPSYPLNPVSPKFPVLEIIVGTAFVP